MIIVSLSTIPSRYDDLNLTLDSLLNQTLKPDKIEVYIPASYNRFPDWDKEPPSLPKGVDLVRCNTDYGPATKVLPAIEKYKSENPIIIYCDDDRVYHPKWVESFVKAHKKRPGHAIANHGWVITKKPIRKRFIKVKTAFDLIYRIKRLYQTFHNLLSDHKKPKPERSWRFLKGGLVDVMEGYGGCLIKPSMFDSSVFEMPKLALLHDDIWLSGKLAQKGVEIWLNPKGRVIMIQEHMVNDPLNEAIFDNLDRDELVNKLVAYMSETFDIWKKN